MKKFKNFNSVSVIIPVHNRKNLLLKALNSVVNQTYKPLEIIIVNDGSSEDLNDVVLKFQNETLNFISYKKSKGAAAARNIGVKAAKGEYIAFLDSDDEWLPNKLEKHIKAIKNADYKVKVSTTRFRLKSSKGKILKIIKPHYRKKISLKDIALGCFVSPGSTMICKKEVFNEVGFFDESLSRLEDWDWLLRYSYSDSVMIVKDSLTIVLISEKPSYFKVRYAIDVIKKKHYDLLLNKSKKLAFKFLSSINFEKAVYAYYNRLYSKTATHLLEATYFWPSIMLRKLYLKLLAYCNKY